MFQWFSQWFDYPAAELLLTGNYSSGLVLLSFLIAVFSSAVAIQIAAQTRSVTSTSLRRIMLATGSIALGGGVWSMHFIGMLAFTLCTDVTYTPGLTVLSMLPSIAASWVALDLISQKRLTLSQLLLGGLLVGSGIGTMHYTGMAAMNMSVALRYDLLMFLISVLVAVVLAILALWIRFGLRHLPLSPNWLTLLSSLVMGAAICGMHYTGMAAARFVPPAGFSASIQSPDQPQVLAMAISFTTLIICSLVVAVNLLLKYRAVSTQAKANEKRLQAIMDTAVDGIVTINSKGLVLGMNKAAEHIFGWQQDELLGRNVNLLTPDSIRPQHDSYLQNYLTTGTAKIIGQGRDVTALHKNGQPLPVRLAIGHVRLPDEDLFVAFITDLRARLQMEAALKENEAKFRSLIGNIPGAAYRCLFNQNWDMLFLSDAIEGISGYPASDFMLPSPKRSWSDVVYPADRHILADESKFRHNFHLEYRIIHRDGSIRWALEQGDAIYNAEGAIVWLDGFIMDISPRKQMETQLRDAKEKAELAAETRAAFLANMSHEIRTPMNAIIGFSDLLLDSVLSPEQKKHLATIHNSAHSLLHLLNDILDSAKLEKGKLELELQNFSLPAVLDGVVSTLWLQARKKQLELTLEFAADLGEFYHGAPDRLRQVLTNLIGNAIKFTDQGSVRVRVSRGDADLIHFSISDTGIGIAADRLPQIFDAFTQADASMSRRFGGTGLGTTISKQLVELMGGSISVYSVPAQGSTFSFTLPLPAASGVTTAGSGFTTTGSSQNALALPPLHILIADDIPQNLELLTILLQRAGHQVTAVTDGVEAVSAATQGGFDLALLDIQMPNLDGLQACRQIRTQEQQQHRPMLPIIALTASVLEEDKTAAKSAGMQGFASKPIHFPQLCQEIARVLGLAIAPTLALSDNDGPVSSQLVNLDKALQLWGSLASYVPALQQFLQQQQPQVAGLVQLAQQADFSALQHQAHAMKGASGNLALEPLAKASGELEQASRQQQQQRCVELAEKITGCWPKFVEQQQKLAQQLQQEYRASPQQSATELRQLLLQLQRSVEQHELDEIAIQQLSQYQGRWQTQVQQLLHALDDFDFQQAQSMLVELAQQLQPGDC